MLAWTMGSTTSGMTYCTARMTKVKPCLREGDMVSMVRLCQEGKNVWQNVQNIREVLLT